MGKRQGKGVILILCIIALCLFLMVVTDGPGFLKGKSAQMPDAVQEPGFLPEENRGDGILSNHGAVSPDFLNKDISVTDSLGMNPEEEGNENREEIFYLSNLAYERSGSQILIALVALLLVAYLILIGPVTYFYLKKIRKMERMWLILPVTALLFGGVILLMSNDFVIKEPYADILKVVSPGKRAVCFGVSTSPGEESYPLYFEDSAKSLQTWTEDDHYRIDEDNRCLTFYPAYAFEKDYFQFTMADVSAHDFVYNIQLENGTGVIYNTTGFTYSHIMLAIDDRYCILPAMNPGDSCVIEASMWKKDEYGMTGGLREELQLQPGLSADEKEIFDFVWNYHSADETGELHIAGISKEGNFGVKDSGVDLIGYSLFYR